MLAGRLGLAPGVWSHLPPDEERANLVDYSKSLLDSLEKKGVTLEQYLAMLDSRDGVDGESVIRFPRG